MRKMNSLKVISGCFCGPSFFLDDRCGERRGGEQRANRQEENVVYKLKLKTLFNLNFTFVTYTYNPVDD